MTKEHKVVAAAGDLLTAWDNYREALLNTYSVTEWKRMALYKTLLTRVEGLRTAILEKVA